MIKKKSGEYVILKGNFFFFFGREWLTESTIRDRLSKSNFNNWAARRRLKIDDIDTNDWSEIVRAKAWLKWIYKKREVRNWRKEEERNLSWNIAAKIGKVMRVMGFPGGLDYKESACNAGDPGSSAGLGRSPGEENGYPLQYSCLENSMDIYLVLWLPIQCFFKS